MLTDKFGRPIWSKSARIDRITELHSKARAEAISLRTENRRLKENVGARNEAIARLRASHDALSRTNKELKERVEELEARPSRNYTSLAPQRLPNSGREAPKEHVNEWKARYRRMKDHCQGLVDAGNYLKAENAELEAEAERMRNDRDQLLMDNAILRGERDSAIRSLHEALRQLAGTDDDFDTDRYQK